MMKQTLLLTLISLKSFSASCDESAYCENSQKHRENFLEWLDSQSRSPIYERVREGVCCTDTDSIEKHPNAGKVFKDEPIPYQVMHNGIKVTLYGYNGQWMSDLIYGLKGHHEPQEERAFYEVLKYIPKNAVMIELGCSWAYYSLWLNSQIQNAQNFLIEPSSDWINIGIQNFALNNKKGTFIQGYAGLFPRDSTLTEGAKQILVDEFLKEYNLEHVHMLHSDIQGQEFEMLKSATDSIRSKKIAFLFISTHSEGVHNDCLDFFKEHDYRVIVHHTPKESFSCDGLIVACSNLTNSPDRINISYKK